jgi:hypothetical protein
VEKNWGFVVRELVRWVSVERVKVPECYVDSRFQEQGSVDAVIGVVRLPWALYVEQDKLVATLLLFPLRKVTLLKSEFLYIGMLDINSSDFLSPL